VCRVPEQLLIATIGGARHALRVTARYERDEQGRVCGALLAFRPADRLRHAGPEADVVATVSHELRSPLAAVKGYSSLLLNQWDRLSDARKRLALRHIDASADRVTRLIEQLLDVSRLESGRLELHPGPVDLRTLTADVVRAVRLAHSDLRCTIEFPRNFPTVHVDRDKIHQVITNLLENAATHGKPDDVKVVGEVLDDAVAVSVHDQGRGIPASELPRIFRKFATRTDGRSGTGLGLWISRGLVEAHGGTLSAMSVPGQGSVFRFTLPLRARSDSVD
jgi:signal transduction histidine kinase